MNQHSRNTMRKLLKASIAASALLVSANVTLAQNANDFASTENELALTQVTLREDFHVVDSYITLGDIFEGAGERADIRVVEAPAPGKRKQLSIYEIGKLATEYDLNWERPKYLKRINITREGQAITEADLHSLVMEQLAHSGLTGDISAKLYGVPRNAYLPLENSVHDITFETFELTGRKDRFRATLLVPTGLETKEYTSLRLTGAVQELRLMPVFARTIVPGDIITEDDINWESFSVRSLNARTVSQQQSLIGQTVRRPINAGKLLLRNDITKPIAVSKGSALTMQLKVGVLELVVGGRALEDGSIGDVIRVENTKSGQAIDAKIISPTLATVTHSNLLLLAAK